MSLDVRSLEVKKILQQHNIRFSFDINAIHNRKLNEATVHVLWCTTEAGVRSMVSDRKDNMSGM